MGTAVRAGVGVLLPSDGFSAATFTVNIVGALGLGFFLEALERLGTGGRAHVAGQLGVGTGFFGGLTTYSTFAVETAVLMRGGDPVTGLLYAGATLLVGALLTALGMGAGILLHRLRRGRAS